METLFVSKNHTFRRIHRILSFRRPDRKHKAIHISSEAGKGAALLNGSSDLQPNLPSLIQSFLPVLVNSEKHRKNHFNGVATIVSKLLTLIKPNKVYFGEKDYQQTQIIKKLIYLENINVNMIICPTVREKNGLALSSRNNFLSNIDRGNSSIIYKSLNLLKSNFNNSNLKSLRKNIINDINKKKNFKVEYLEIANAETLQIDEKINPTKQYRAFICVRVNEVRLIDNILLN